MAQSGSPEYPLTQLKFIRAVAAALRGGCLLQAQENRGLPEAVTMQFMRRRGYKTH